MNNEGEEEAEEEESNLSEFSIGNKEKEDYYDEEFEAQQLAEYKEGILKEFDLAEGTIITEKGFSVAC